MLNSACSPEKFRKTQKECLDWTHAKNVWTKYLNCKANYYNSKIFKILFLMKMKSQTNNFYMLKFYERD